MFSTNCVDRLLMCRNQSFPAPDGWLTFVTFTVYALLGFLEVTFVWGKGASGSRAAQYNRLPVCSYNDFSS